jgi:HK97 family phage portal protein
MNEGLINKAIGLFWKKKSAEGWDPLLWGLRTDHESGEVGYKNFSGLKNLYYGTAFTCINANASSMASVPLHYYHMITPNSGKALGRTKQVSKKEKDYLFAREDVQWWMQRKGATDIEEVLEHPSLDLLSHVNKRYTRHNLLELTGQYLEGYGNCFWRLIFKSVGKEKIPSDIWFLEPDQIKPEFEDDGSVKYYEYGKDNKKIPGSEVIHFWYPSILDPFWGCSPLVGAAIAANIEKCIQVYAYNTFKNPLPAGALTSENIMQEEAVKKVMKQIEDIGKGRRRANRLVALGNVGKGAKIEKLGINPDEMEFIEGAKMSREWVANAYGIPTSYLTDAGSNRSVSLQGDTRYWRNTITPKLTREAEELTESLARLYNDNGFYAFENCVPEDTMMKIQERKANLSTGFGLINEERLAEEREAIEGGDEPLVPSNMIPLKQLLEGRMPTEQDMEAIVDAFMRLYKERRNAG